MRSWDRKALEKLLIVQEIDIKIRVEKDGINELNLRNMREDPVLNNMKAELVTLAESLQSTRSQQEMYRNTLEDIRNAIKGLASTRSGAFKPRTRSSTEALRSEEEKLGVLVEETEDQIQKLRQQHDGTENEIALRSRNVRAFQQAPEAEIRKHRGRIRKLEEQREVAVKGIPAMLLRKYERLKMSRSGVGLTIMVDGVCRVCRMQMPTGVRFRLLKGEPISSCPACGRMVARVENPAQEAEDAARAAAAEAAARVHAGGGSSSGGRAEDRKRGEKRPARVTKPAASKPESKRPAAKKPAAKKPAAKKPAAKKPAAKKPAAKKPAAKKPARKTDAKKTAAKKPTGRSPISKKKSTGRKK
jgi:predicted  nucleic acid-binding Zn-ribbon protein